MLYHFTSRNDFQVNSYKNPKLLNRKLNTGYEFFWNDEET